MELARSDTLFAGVRSVLEPLHKDTPARGEIEDDMECKQQTLPVPEAKDGDGDTVMDRDDADEEGGINELIGNLWLASKGVKDSTEGSYKS